VADVGEPAVLTGKSHALSTEKRPDSGGNGVRFPRSGDARQWARWAAGPFDFGPDGRGHACAITATDAQDLFVDE
jgi:hypothetical protein